MSAQLATRCAALMALACVLLAGAAAATDAASPEKICASTTQDERRRLNTTAYVTCYQQKVWEVVSCPPGFRFRQGLQICTRINRVPLVPKGRPDATATGEPNIFLYVWAGPDNPGPNCRDAVAVIDGTPESATFGKVLNVVYTPTWGNEPHHVGLSNNTFLAVGGIQAYLRGNPDIYIFNTTQPDDPVFLKSVDPPLSAVTDSFSGQSDGGFWVSQMGDATGGTPGRLVRLNGQFDVMKEFPEVPPPGFNPHGFAIEPVTRSRLVTADYLELKASITGPGIDPQFIGDGKLKYRHTLRVWNLPDFTLAGEFDAGANNAEGFMTVQFVGSSGVAVSGNGKGVLWALNATNPTGAQPAHVIGRDTSSCVMIPLGFSAGKRFFVTVLGLNLVQLVDTSSPLRWRVIQEIYLPRGTYPHAATAAKNGTLIAVSTYYLNQVYNDQTVGVLRQKGTSKVFLFDVLDNGNAIRYNRRVPSIDFRNEVNRFRGDCGADSACGQWRPHGMVFKTVSAPVPVTPRGAACKNNRRGRAARG